MTKRIICALFICIVLLSVTFVSVSADSYFWTDSAVAPFPFNDVSKSSWQYAPVKKVYDLGIMNGVSATRFEPNKKLTRAEAAMILYNLEGKNASYARYSFKDVKPGAWYADAVEWMYKKGITSGVTKDRFGVGEYITRQDFITFIYRLYELKWGLKSNNSGIYVRNNVIDGFRDAGRISSYAMPAMRLCAGICMVVTHDPTRHINVEPVIKGNNGYINPRGNCTRAEAAVIIGNAYTIDRYVP
ncbi:MAG: S-layer homology domain-containing protein [Clostridia bacterium]|nr:S-layer homology domain-containing protein [Clostridia bacterium]